MKLSVIATALVLYLYSCAPGNKNNHPKNTSGNDSSKSLVIGNPLDYGVKNVLLFPVGCNYNPNVEEREDLYSQLKSSFRGFTLNSTTSKKDKWADVEYINENENDFDIRNVLFYDQISGKSFPLLKDTMHVLSFSIHKEFKKPMIFYRIVKSDFNKDEKYNSEDGVMLFVSSLNGDSLVQITPSNEQFIDYFYYPETDKILTKTFIDRNNDSVYTISDETNFRQMDILKPAMGLEIFSSSLKDSLRL